MNILGLITARGGSKGLPGKNLAPLAGKPLIGWTIDAAMAARSLARIIVSTDDSAIADTCRARGVDVPFLRPAELATDTASHLSVVDHALNHLRIQDRWVPDAVLLLQPTSPLRTAKDIDACATLADREGVEAVVSVCPAEDHPYLVKKLDPAGRLADYVTPELRYVRRQDFPPALVLNGAVFLSRTESLARVRSFVPPGTLPYVMRREDSVDIDTLEDLAKAEEILRSRASR
jgi:CMP-N,N'-diacetyllegionaminic acid synthase